MGLNLTRYIVMVRRPNGLMKIVANKASRAEAQEIAEAEGGVVKTVGTKRRKKKR